MKTKLDEYSETFFLELLPESQEDEHILVRFGLNATKELKFASVIVMEDDTVAQICILKRKRPLNSLDQGKVT